MRGMGPFSHKNKMEVKRWGCMIQQANLASFSSNKDLGKKVRNYSYNRIVDKEETSIQRNIIRKLLMAHPEGITDLEICIITGFKRSSVNARRNEIPEAIGVGIAKIVDIDGDRLNTLWGFSWD